MYKITTATVNDIPLIRELTFKVWPQTYASIISEEQIDYMLEMMYSQQSLEQQMRNGAQFIFLSDESEAVGFASFQEISKGVFKLHKLYILPSEQGNGAGKFMIDFITGIVQKNKGTSIQLQVNKYNKAKMFYQKLGFVVIKEAEFDIGNGYVMDDYVMEKRIN